MNTTDNTFDYENQVRSNSGSTPEQLADEALHHALAFIQDPLGVATGDGAAIFFSDTNPATNMERQVVEILAEYVRYEQQWIEEEPT